MMSSPSLHTGKRKTQAKHQRCDACGEVFAKLAGHLKKNPVCMAEMQAKQPESPRVEQPKKPRLHSVPRVTECDVKTTMYLNKLRSSIAHSRLELHEDMFVSMAHADRAYQQVFSWMDLVFQHAIEQVRVCSNAETALTQVWQSTSGVMKEMISWDRVRSTVYKSLQIKPLLPIARSASLVRSKSLHDSRFANRELAELSITQLIVQLLQCDEYARLQILKASEVWKTGDLDRASPSRYEDITDGLVFREHPHLPRAATEAEKDDIRVALYLYNDDFTSVNAIGTKRGAHKYSVHMAAIANLPTRVRFKTEYILPFLIAQSKLIEGAGLAQILCGVDDSGTMLDDQNFAAEMRELAQGVVISIPDNENGGMR